MRLHAHLGCLLNIDTGMIQNFNPEENLAGENLPIKIPDEG